VRERVNAENAADPTGEAAPDAPGEPPRALSDDAPADASDPKLALRVHVRLVSCRNLLMRESKRSVERYGLTLPHFDALAELGRSGEGGFTFGELSRLLLVTSGNLTGIVDRLEAEGFVRREQDQEDRRIVRIVLTPNGRRLVDRVAPLHARDIQEALSFMPPEDLVALNDLLDALRRGLRERGQ
jgi:DNA-binding MarR family transcriptional regulator